MKHNHIGVRGVDGEKERGRWNINTFEGIITSVKVAYEREREA